MRKSKEELEKVTLNITKGDKETLATFHSTIGWSVAARALINKYCEWLRKEAESKGLDGAVGSINMEEILRDRKPTIRSGPEVAG